MVLAVGPLALIDEVAQHVAGPALEPLEGAMVRSPPRGLPRVYGEGGRRGVPSGLCGRRWNCAADGETVQPATRGAAAGSARKRSRSGRRSRVWSCLGSVFRT